MPDLNSVPPSPHSLAQSRRQSQQQVPQQPQTANDTSSSSSLNILPSNQNTVNHRASSPSLSSPQLSASLPAQSQNAPEAGVGPGPGPIRHPRPLTASELHAQLEKEQEAVVNRLTRELTLLRAQQNASVVSNTSSTSASNSATTPTHESVADTSLLSGSGFSIPTSRRHHRNSSSASQTAARAQLASTSYEGVRIHHPRPTYQSAAPLSRQSSSTSRRSQNNSPAPPSSLDPSSYFHNQRVPAPPTSMPTSSVVATPGSFPSADQLSPGLLPATQRYEETAFYRSELESAKKENEALKRRVRELERQVRDRRESDVSRSRSESVATNTTAGGNIGGTLGREHIRVGESAASSGVRSEDS